MGDASARGPKVAVHRIFGTRRPDLRLLCTSQNTRQRNVGHLANIAHRYTGGVLQVWDDSVIAALALHGSHLNTQSKFISASSLNLPLHPVPFVVGSRDSRFCTFATMVHDRFFA